MMPLILAQTAKQFPPPGEAPGIPIGFLLFSLVLTIVALAGMWKTFEKAGKPGWSGIIPIYNLIVWLEIINRPLWWIAVVLLVPCVGLVFFVIMAIDMAKSFGKGAGFGVGLALLGFIFFPILGFGSATYRRLSRPA